jgi:coiled-coil and C2 domain-containing protein 2A
LYASNIDRARSRILQLHAHSKKSGPQSTHVHEHYLVEGEWFPPEAAFSSTQRVRPRVNSSAEPAETVFVAPDTVSAAARSLGKSYSLEIDIKSVQLTDHPLFDEEDALASELTQCYRTWCSRIQTHRLDTIDTRISSIQEAIASHSKQLRQSSPVALAANHWSTSIDLEAELHSHLLRRSEIERDNLDIFKRMITVWNKIKSLRNEKKFCSTGIRMQVKKLRTNADEDRLRLAQLLDAEVASLMRKHRASHERSVARIQQKKEELEHQRQRIQARIKQLHEASEGQVKAKSGSFISQLSKIKEETDGQDQDEEVDAADEVLSTPKSARRKRNTAAADGSAPTPARDASEGAALVETNPHARQIEAARAAEETALAKVEERLLSLAPPVFQDLDEAALRESVSKRHEEMLRKPGEPDYVPLVEANGLPVTPDDSVPVDEQMRRRRLRGCRMTFTVVLNGTVVTKSLPASLDTDFRVSFGQKICLKLHSSPQSLTIKISHTGVAEFYTELQIPVPSITLLSEQSTAPLHFACDEPFEPVQPPISHPPAHQAGSNRFMSGLLFLHSAWGSSDPADPSAYEVPPSNEVRVHHKLNAALLHSGVHRARLQEWMSLASIDPNDPKNSELVEALQNLSSSNDASATFCVTNFCTTPMSFQGEQRRIELIAWRAKHSSQSRGVRVPIRDSEVEDEDVALISNSQDEMRANLQRMEATSDMTRRQRKIAAFYNRVQELQRLAQGLSLNLQPQLQFQDVVHVIDAPVISFKLIIDSITSLLRKREKLKPEYKERRAMAVRRDQACNLCVQVIRGFNLPTRAPGSGQPEGDATGGELFVEMRFQGQKSATTPIQGPSPQWNQMLQVQVDAPRGEFSPSVLMGMADKLHINVFDRLQTTTKLDAIDDPTGSGSIKHDERRWMGSLSVPFSTIYSSERIEGVFELQGPGHIIGYSKSNDTPMLQLLITLDPPLLQPQVEDAPIPVLPEALLRRARTWSSSVQQLLPPGSRAPPYACMTLDGAWALLPQFIGAQQPPPEVTTPDEAARFVSLIPFVDDWPASNDSNSSGTSVRRVVDVWCSTAEFIEIHAGDWEEHAVLLCNYLLHFGFDAYVALGQGVPEGSTVYVLSRPKTENSTWQLWNACTSTRYATTDTNCSLKVIEYIVNGGNIWANIQSSKEVCRCSYNLADPRSWLPLFDVVNPRPDLQLLNPPAVAYTKPSLAVAEAFEREIHQHLKDKVR